MPDKQYIIIRNDISLVLYRPKGIFKESNIFHFLQFIYDENEMARDFSRFIDTSEVIDFIVDPDLVKLTAEFRKNFIKRQAPAKTCIFFNTELAREFAEKYRSIMDPNWIDVFVSDNIDECAKFLAVQKEVLKDF